MCDCEAPRVSVVVRSCLTVTVLGWAPSFQSLSRHTFSLGSWFLVCFVRVFIQFHQSENLCVVTPFWNIENIWRKSVPFFPPKKPQPENSWIWHLTHTERSAIFFAFVLLFLCAIFGSAKQTSNHSGEKCGHTRSYWDASIVMNREKIRRKSTDRGGNISHDGWATTNRHSIVSVSLDLAEKENKKQSIDFYFEIFPDFIFLFPPFQKYLPWKKQKSRDKWMKRMTLLFSFLSLLVTHSNILRHCSLYVHFFFLPPKN